MPISIFSMLVFAIFTWLGAGAVESVMRDFAVEVNMRTWIFIAVPGLLAMLFALLLYRDAPTRRGSASGRSRARGERPIEHRVAYDTEHHDRGHESHDRAEPPDLHFVHRRLLHCDFSHKKRRPSRDRAAGARGYFIWLGTVQVYPRPVMALTRLLKSEKPGVPSSGSSQNGWKKNEATPSRTVVMYWAFV